MLLVFTFIYHSQLGYMFLFQPLWSVGSMLVGWRAHPIMFLFHKWPQIVWLFVYKAPILFSQGNNSVRNRALSEKPAVPTIIFLGGSSEAITTGVPKEKNLLRSSSAIHIRIFRNEIDWDKNNRENSWGSPWWSWHKRCFNTKLKIHGSSMTTGWFKHWLPRFHEQCCYDFWGSFHE